MLNVSSITYEILVTKRQYYIDRVKDPFRNALVNVTSRGRLLGKILLFWDILVIVISVFRYPEPTRENAEKKITHVLFDIWDEFEKWNRARIPLYKAARKITLCVAESDTSYSQRMTWFLRELSKRHMKGEWPPLPPYCPSEAWADPVVKKAAVEERKRLKREMALGHISGVET